MAQPRWVDNHCHLAPASAENEVSEARAAGVQLVVDIGTDLESSRQAIAVAERLDGVWATAGVHPHDASGGTAGIEELLGHHRVVAVGECGLDYHYEHSPREAQREVFAEQVVLARRFELPLVVHSREAWADTFDILSSVGAPPQVVMHCFSGGPDEARRSLALGAHLSFSGIVSFPRADEVRAAAALCPSDRLLVETDSPYLAPVPHRGRRNRPALLPWVGAALAEARGEPVEAVAEVTWVNSVSLYRLTEPRE